MDDPDQALPKTVRIEIIAYAPTAFYHCQHCEVTFQEAGVGPRIHQEQVAQALPEDLRRDYQAVSDWVRALTEHYRGSVIVKVIDAASVEGFWKSLRYRVRQYPAVIVEGKEKHVGADLASAYRLIERHFAASAVA